MANKIKNVACPAFTRGYVAACRFCIWYAGGPSEKCLEKKREYDIREHKIIKKRKAMEDGDSK